MRQIILDTETTGLQTSEGHRIIEIGCLELINRKLTGQRYHQYINPLREIEEGAAAVHGVTTQFLQDKPIFSEIVAEFIDFISGAELIIHNAPFDVGFINYEFSLISKKYRPLTNYCQIIDTLVIARQLHVGQRNSLDALCKRYSIDNSHRELHGALLDAHLLAQVYLAMTGGQGSLFDSLQTGEDTGQKNHTANILPQIKRELRILSANAEEIEAHEEMLAKMVQQGKCLWSA